MLKFVPLWAVLFALSSQVGSATVVLAVGTTDGILVCEDTRMTSTDQYGNQTYTDSTHKAQRHGSFGFSAAAGTLAPSVQERIGGLLLGSTISNYDILGEIKSFFVLNDIRRFDLLMASQLEPRLEGEVRKPSSRTIASLAPSVIAPKLVEVFLYWIDYADQLRVYGVHLTDSSLSDPLYSGFSISPSGVGSWAPPRIKGVFLPLSKFATSKPLVTADGQLVYKELASGERPGFVEFREDPELKPFLVDFVEANKIDPLAATRAIKKLISVISGKQDSVRAGIGVGPDSDCYLAAKGGVREMNAEVTQADERDARKKAESEASLKGPTKRSKAPTQRIRP